MQAVFEAHNMRHSYWRFLVGVTNGRIGQLNWEEVDRFDTHSSLQHRTPTTSPATNDDSVVT